MRKSYNVLVTKKKYFPQEKLTEKQKNNFFHRYWRYFYLRLLRLRGNPHAIAIGLAIGVFAGFFPFFGLQTILAILFAIIFQANKIAAAAATWISNPLTYVPIFAFNFHIGQLILGGEDFAFDELDFKSSSEILEVGGNFAITLLLGCLITGSIISVCTYFLSLKLIYRLRKNTDKTNKI